MNRNGLMCVEDLTREMENIPQTPRESQFPLENETVKAGGRGRGLAYYNTHTILKLADILHEMIWLCKTH